MRRNIVKQIISDMSMPERKKSIGIRMSSLGLGPPGGNGRRHGKVLLTGPSNRKTLQLFMDGIISFAPIADITIKLPGSENTAARSAAWSFLNHPGIHF